MKKLTTHPDIEKLALATLNKDLIKGAGHSLNTIKLLSYFSRIIDLDEFKNVVVIGCGPRPETVKYLTANGYNALGIEPYAPFLKNANEYLEANKVINGTAEQIPLEANSQDIYLCENVLEHVDSPSKSLDEAYRVLRPGGIAYIMTSNKYLFSWKGANGEYNVPFYNWFPKLVKEGYIHKHLHYKPSLANYSAIPAVHWFSYSKLCELGRYSGFSTFYSLMDLLDPSDESVANHFLRRTFLKLVQWSPWLRALALRQFGGGIIMRKR